MKATLAYFGTMCQKPLKMSIFFDLVIPFLGIYPNEWHIQRYKNIHCNILIEWKVGQLELVSNMIVFIKNYGKYNCMCVLSHVQLFVTPWTVAHRAPLSMRFSGQEYCSRLPFPSPGDLPDPGINPLSCACPYWQVDSLSLAPPGKPGNEHWGTLRYLRYS